MSNVFPERDKEGQGEIKKGFQFSDIVREVVNGRSAEGAGFSTQSTVPLKEESKNQSGLGEVPLKVTYPLVTREELSELKIGDKIISKTGTARFITDIIGNTVLFSVQKEFHGSDLDRAFMNLQGNHLRQQDFDQLERGSVVLLIKDGIRHIVLDVYRNNDPIGSPQPFVSGIRTTSIDIAEDFVRDTSLNWISHIEKK